MKAMVLDAPRMPLREEERPVPVPGRGEVLLKVEACGVCRTDLHVLDGDLPGASFPVVLGHEVVGTVAALGTGVTRFAVGQRLGVPWLGETCGDCVFCASGRENLCDRPTFTGFHRDGGFPSSARG